MRTIYKTVGGGSASPADPTQSNDPYDTWANLEAAEETQTDDLTIHLTSTVDISAVIANGGGLANDRLRTDDFQAASIRVVGDVNEPRMMDNKATIFMTSDELVDHGGSQIATIENCQIVLKVLDGQNINLLAAVSQTLRLNGCIVTLTDDSVTTTGSVNGFRALGSPVDMRWIIKSIFYNLDKGGTNCYGIRDNSGTELLNGAGNIFFNCGTGVRLSNAACNMQNSIIGGNAQGDYFGNWVPDYNISEDASAAGTNGTTVADVSALFLDAANGDFRLSAAGIAAVDGAGNPNTDQLTYGYTTDITGQDVTGSFPIGPSAPAAVLSIDSIPASIQRDGAVIDVVVSDPATVPTTLNTTATLGGQGVLVGAVSGSGPYTIQVSAHAAIALQHGDHLLQLDINGETVSANIALVPPSGWASTDLVNPSGGALDGYTAKATPVTGDEIVYDNTFSPSGDSFTISADGSIAPSVAQVGQQTFDRYIIEADGTILATETYTYNPSVLSITSVSNPTPTVGDQITLNLSNASASGKTLSIPAGSLAVDSQDASTIVFTVPDPGAFGNNQTSFLSATTITVTDGPLTATIDIQIQPEAGHAYAVITEVSGIHATVSAALVAQGGSPIVVGDRAEGYFASGSGDVDLSTGAINPAESSVFRIRYQDSTDNYTWGAYGDVALEPVVVDNVPDQFDLGANVLAAELNAATVRTFILSGIDAGESVTATATGDGEVSTDGVNYSATALVQNGNTVYIRGNASGTYETTVSVGVTISGVSDSFDITTRAANAPSITAQPQSQSVNDGDNFSFSIVASNAVSYQWYDASNDSPISGATASTYTGVAQVASNGLQVYCVATSSEGGTVQSATVTLTVTSTAGISFAAVGAFTNGAAWSTPAEAGQVRGSETGITVILLNGSTLVSRTTNNTTDASGILNSIATPGIAINTTLLCIVWMPDGSSAVFEQNVGNIA